MEGYLERVYLELEASPNMSIVPDDDTDYTKELDGEYDSEYDVVVDMRMVDDLDTLYDVHVDSDVDMQIDCDNDDKSVQWRKTMSRKMSMRRRIRTRRSMTMRMMAKSLRQLPRERWQIHWRTI